MPLNDLFAAAMQSASAKATELLRKPVRISVQEIAQGGWSEVGSSLKEYSLALPVSIGEGANGTGVILLDARYAALIAELMFENEPKALPEKLTELQTTAAGEALSQTIGAMSEGMTKVSKRRISVVAGELTQGAADGLAAARAAIKEKQVAAVRCRIKIGDYDESELACVIPASVAESLQVAAPAGISTPGISLGAPQATGSGGARVQPVAFGTIGPTGGPEAAAPGNLDMLLDVPLEVTVELGRANRRVRDVLNLGPGSVVELSKLAGEPVDLLVNGKPIAKGEVVVIDENFAVRITEILAREERLSGGL